MDRIINSPTIGDILFEEFMEPNGISAYKLAKDINVPTSRIQDILHGRRKMSADTSVRLGAYFRMSYQYFLNLQSDLDIQDAKSALDLNSIVPVPSADRIIEYAERINSHGKTIGILEKDGLSIEVLESISYRSILGKTLKKNLHYYNKEELLADVDKAIAFYDGKIDCFENLSIDYRVKSAQSAHLKYERYYPDSLVEKVFNDLIGFRSLCDSYSDVMALSEEQGFRVADMTKGKANDDGYRGVHVYYQVDHFHYPIEIQYNTYYDRQINNWLHSFLYKKGYDKAVGKRMREEYEKGRIKTDLDFEEVLKDVLSGC